MSYNSNAETAPSDKWLYSPDSGGAYGSGMDDYVGPHGSNPATVSFYDASDDSLLFTPAVWDPTYDGWIQGSFDVGFGGSPPYSIDIYAVVTIDSGTYAGWYYILDTDSLDWSEGTETPLYVSGGTNPDGTGWIPEPATYALFALGIATIAVRRFRRK